MVSWTTNVAEIAPAVAKLGRPLRALRIPVDEWAVALALALRAFPMLIDEFRVLYAARRLRPKDVAATRRGRVRNAWLELIDLLATAITVALRRADEMGDAITARGGAGQISASPSGPQSNRRWAFVIVAVVCGTHSRWSSRSWAPAPSRATPPARKYENRPKSVTFPTRTAGRRIGA